MARSYVDVSKFRAPFNYPNLTLTGLGEETPLRNEWPAGRSYVDTSRYRAPYLDYQFQDNTLFGLGGSVPGDARCVAVRVPISPKHPSGMRTVCAGDPLFPKVAPRARATKARRGTGDLSLDKSPLPPGLQAYIKTGQPMSTFRRDLGSALAQVPRVVWGLGALTVGYFAYKAWKAP